MIEVEHGDFLRATCFAQGGIKPESAKDVAQRVLEIATRLFDEKRPIHNLRGWLVRLAEHETANYRGTWKPDVAPDADAAEVASPLPDPEGTAALAESRSKLWRYLDGLPQPQAEVIVCADVYGMTVEETAVAVGRAPGTVAAQIRRAREKLGALAKESKRATAAGERRRGGRRS